MMTGRVEFGCDFLYLARTLQWEASSPGEHNPVTDAAARLFLLQWGLSVEESDKANELFFERLKAETLGEFHLAYQRIVDHALKDRAAQERIVMQFTALCSMDFDITDKEATFVRWFMDGFDMRPSEFEALSRRGWDLALGLDFFGRAYLEAKAE